MELSGPLVVAFALSQKRKAIVADALAGASAVVYLTELDELARGQALQNTGVLLTFNPSKELRPGEAKLLDGARLIQFSARTDGREEVIRFKPQRRRKKNPKTTYALGGYAVCCLTQVF
jgi:hypothetical protein